MNLILAAGASLCLFAPASYPQVELTMNRTGVAALRWRGVDYLNNGTPRVVSGGCESPRVTIRRTTIESTCSWGSTSVSYTTERDRLNITVAVHNGSKASLENIGIEPLVLRFPVPPAEYNGSTPVLAHNAGMLPVTSLTAGDVRVILTIDELSSPLLAGFPWSLNKPTNTVFPLRIQTGRDPMLPDSLPVIQRPVAPGRTETFSVSLHFTESTRDALSAVPDLVRLFRRQYPFALRWPDRRPIGALILATAATGWKNNPRGWLLKPDLDVTTTAGRERFRRTILSWADNSVRVLRSMNAQGAITWDIEGEEFPHPTTYIGDPRLLQRLAPEMDAIADENFRTFRDAGLRVGICIRPQTLAFTASSPQQTESADPFAELAAKIAFAKARWGATLFYIDSNGDRARPLDVRVVSRLQQLHPDVLLIPEHETTAYFGVSAPYAELREGVTGTPAEASAVYPDSFSVVNVSDGSLDNSSEALRRAIGRGDILLFRGWWNDPANSKVLRLYREVSTPPFSPARD